MCSRFVGAVECQYFSPRDMGWVDVVALVMNPGSRRDVDLPLYLREMVEQKQMPLPHSTYWTWAGPWEPVSANPPTDGGDARTSTSTASMTNAGWWYVNRMSARLVVVFHMPLSCSLFICIARYARRFKDMFQTVEPSATNAQRTHRMQNHFSQGYSCRARYVLMYVCVASMRLC